MTITGGIKRLKQHLVGGYSDVIKCPKTTTAIASVIESYLQAHKRTKLITLDDYCQSSGVGLGSEEHSYPTPSSTTSTSKRLRCDIPRPKGQPTIDSKLRRTPEEIVDERRSKETIQTTIENRMRTVEDKDRVLEHISNWFYECGIPFNTVKARSFEVMVESIAQYGSGLQPPSYHELRVPLLEKAKKKTDELKKAHQATWKQYGCSLMSDGWTDKRGRHLINFLVNSPKGSFFLGSVDASSEVQDAKMLFNLLDNKIEEIGPENVVQVVTDNASNYKAAGKMLMEKRPTLIWTPCATHCLDLMLEDISNLKEFRSAINDAKRITNFIYRHTRLLDMTRKMCEDRDLVRHGVTRFATSFLTLQSLLNFQAQLKRLFVCEDWVGSKLATTEAEKRVTDIVLAERFWNGVKDCLRASQPLLVVLRIIDGDERSAMPELLAAMEEAKKKIKLHFENKPRLYKKVIDIVERRWECQMQQKLYSALFLNLGKYFDIEQENNELAMKLVRDFDDVLDRLEPNIETHDKISSQIDHYKSVQNGFEKESVIRARTSKTPMDWWGRYGGNADNEATKLALRILGLCCSSSGCERNWSTFEFIHTKKRNRLEHERLNKLVYIQYNRRLVARFKQREEEGKSFDPIALDDFNWSSEWMLMGQSEDELVHPEDGPTGLRWRDVDVAVGASTSIQGRTSMRIQGSAASGSCTTVYSRRGRMFEANPDENVEELDLEEPLPEDDLDVGGDCGEMENESPSTQHASQNDDDIILDNFVR